MRTSEITRASAWARNRGEGPAHSRPDDGRPRVARAKIGTRRWGTWLCFFRACKAGDGSHVGLHDALMMVRGEYSGSAPCVPEYWATLDKELPG